MISRVKLVSIPVADQARAVRFYTEKLGCRVTSDQPYDGKQRWIELALPGGGTRIVPFVFEGMEDRVGTFQNVVFTADDVEATYRELTALGVEFVQPPKTEEWGTGAVFRDSEGNMFALTSGVDAGSGGR
ncbi:MAG TPA: VOC family protein [Longimicrobiales bacterium]|nr:VOC family protein [Longimicrobiales bacterium]